MQRIPRDLARKYAFDWEDKPLLRVQPGETIEIETAATPDAAIIWLHGLGADGNDFVPVVPELVKRGERAWRFVFPHAPARPVTINGGLAMRAWYDISDAAIRREDEKGVRESQARVEALMTREKTRGVAASRIVLAGFSQGGAIALQTALRHPERVAGVMAPSSSSSGNSSFAGR